MTTARPTPLASDGDAPGEHRPLIREPVLVATAASAALAGLADLVMRHEAGLTGDEPFYELMASHPGRTHSFPYADRIVVPGVVHILPFGHVVSFQLLALLCIAAIGGVLCTLLRDFGVPAWLATALAIGCAVSPNLLVVVLRHGRSIDPATTLVMVLGTLLIVRRRLVGLAVTVLIGVGIKETTLVLIPFAYAVWARRLWDLRALRDTAAIGVAPVLGYLAIRVGVPSIGSGYTPGVQGGFLHNRAHEFRQAFSASGIKRAAYAYGPLWIAAPFALRGLSFARRSLVLVALCVVALSVSSDTGRVLFFAVASFYTAGAWVVRDRPRLALLLVVALFAVDAGYAGYMQVHGVQYGLDTTPPAPIPLH